MLLGGAIAAGLGSAALSEGRARFLAVGLVASALAYVLAPVLGAFRFFGDNWPLSLALFLMLVASGFALGLVARQTRS